MLLVSFIVCGAGITWHANSIIVGMANVHVRTTETFLEDYAGEVEQVWGYTPDGLGISAWHFPQAEPRGVVVVLHGMHGMDGAAMLDVAKFFHTQGYAALAVDMRAHGRSEGGTISFGYNEVLDVSTMIDLVTSQPMYENTAVILYGHSMGASTAIRTAAQRDDVSAVISVAAYESIERQIEDYMRASHLPEIIVCSYQPFFKMILGVRYGVNPASASPLADIGSISPRPLLLIHGDADEQTSVEHANRLCAKAGDNADLWVVEGGNHFIFNGSILDAENAWFGERLMDFLSTSTISATGE